MEIGYMTRSFEFGAGYAEDGEKIMIIRFYAQGDCSGPSTGEVRMSYKTFEGLVSKSSEMAKDVQALENGIEDAKKS